MTWSGKRLPPGGTTYNEPKDHGFQDPDGHIWELVHMESDG
ncbi:MAG: hypothetical protein WD795_07350 [Woeseia sp.]